MAEKTVEKRHWLATAWEWLSHYGNLQTLGSLFASFGISNWVTSMLPGGWHPPQYWAVFGTALFGTAFALSLVAVVVRRVGSKWRDYQHPRMLDVSCESGRRKASMLLRHHGEPSRYKIEGRIQKMWQSDVLNPAPTPFHAELQPGGGSKGDFEVELSDGQFAVVIVADIGDNVGDFGGTYWLQVRRGKYGSSTMIPDSGAVIEYVISVSPPIKNTVTTRRFRVWRDTKNHFDFVQIEEV